VENGTILFMFYRSSGHYWFRVNLIKPGRFINKESRESLIQNFSVDASQKIEMASAKRMVLFNRLLISFQIIFSKL
jgi:hypothetical protein